MTAALSTAGVEPACVDEVEVALSEACTNAVKHAVAGVTYEVMVSISDEQISIEVVDSGSGFGQHNICPDGRDHWAEDGRGMALMNALSDLALFDSVDGEGGFGAPDEEAALEPECTTAWGGPERGASPLASSAPSDSRP